MVWWQYEVGLITLYFSATKGVFAVKRCIYLENVVKKLPFCLSSVVCAVPLLPHHTPHSFLAITESALSFVYDVFENVVTGLQVYWTCLRICTGNSVHTYYTLSLVFSVGGKNFSFLGSSWLVAVGRSMEYVHVYIQL